MSISVRAVKKNQFLLLGVIATGLALLPTAYVALQSNSIILWGDFLRSFIDFLAIALSWRIVVSLDQTDTTFFDYGRGKLEQVASLSIGLAMMSGGVILALGAAFRVVYPQSLSGAGIGLLWAALSLLGNLVVSRINSTMALQQQSSVLEAQSRLYWGKSAASTIVLVSLLIAIVWPRSTIGQYSDPFGSFLLAAFLVYSGSGLFSSSWFDLLDRSIEERYRVAILKVLVEYEALYRGFQTVRSRRSGGKRFVEIQLQFGHSETIGEIDAKIAQLTPKIREAIDVGEVIIIPSSTTGGTKSTTNE